MTTPIGLLASLAGVEPAAAPAPADDPAVFGQLLLAALSLPVAPRIPGLPPDRPPEAPPAAAEENTDSADPAPPAVGDTTEDLEGSHPAPGQPISVDAPASDEVSPPPRGPSMVARSAPVPASAVAIAVPSEQAALSSGRLTRHGTSSASAPIPLAAPPAAPATVAEDAGRPAGSESPRRDDAPGRARVTDGGLRAPPSPAQEARPARLMVSAAGVQPDADASARAHETGTHAASVPAPRDKAGVGTNRVHVDAHRVVLPMAGKTPTSEVEPPQPAPEPLEGAREPTDRLAPPPRMSRPRALTEAEDAPRPSAAPDQDRVGKTEKRAIGSGLSAQPGAVPLQALSMALAQIAGIPAAPLGAGPDRPGTVDPMARPMRPEQDQGARVDRAPGPSRATWSGPRQAAPAAAPAPGVPAAVHAVLTELAELTQGVQVRELRVTRGGRGGAARDFTAGTQPARPAVAAGGFPMPPRDGVVPSPRSTPVSVQLPAIPSEGVQATEFPIRQATDPGAVRPVATPILPAPRQEMPPDESERPTEAEPRRAPPAAGTNAPTSATAAVSASVAAGPTPRMSVGAEPAAREAHNLPKDDGEQPRAAGLADRVTIAVTDDAGRQTRIRVAVLGEQVRATIVPPDGDSARQLERRMDDLTAALVRRGFVEPKVTVQHATEGAAWAGAASGSRSDSEVPRGTDQPAGDQRQGSGRREQERQGDGQQRHPHHRPRQRDPEDRRR